jgi:Flp pilus assembly protein TadD
MTYGFEGALRTVCILGLVTLLTGCASVTYQASQSPDLDNQEVPVIENVDVLAVSPAMIEFMDTHVPKNATRGEKAWTLSHVTIDPYILGFRYEPDLTLPANEAFDRRAGNCLSFAHLLVSMARHLGLKAHYQQVHIRPEWNSESNTLLLSMHVNVVVETGTGEYVIDISGRKTKELDFVTRLNHSEARAQHFNNLGVDALLEEDLGEAYSYFRQAIRTDSGLSYLWSNLGVVFNRNGQTSDAIWAYEAAMQKDRFNDTASNNLLVIHEREGNLEAAQALEREVERHQRKNPYHLLARSQQAIDEGRYEDSIRLLNRAIKLKNSEYRLHAQLARSYYLAGDRVAARNSYDQALALAPDGFELELETGDSGIPEDADPKDERDADANSGQ